MIPFSFGRYDRIGRRLQNVRQNVRLVEMAHASAVFHDPRHPYTQRLLSAAPVPHPRRRRIHERPSTTQIVSPIYPLDHQVEPSTYDEVTPATSFFAQTEPDEFA